MARLYTGEVRSMYIKNMQITEHSKVLIFEESVLLRDAFFYKNILGKKINFVYGKQLPSKLEAMEKLKNGKANKVTFVDYENLHYQQSVTFAKIKKMKKSYR